MKDFLAVKDALNRDEPTGKDRKRCLICIENIRGKENYKAKKQKLAKVKWMLIT